MSNDEQAIRGLIAAWLHATEAGDTAALASLMAEDAVFLTAGQPPMVGRAAFAPSFEAATKRFRIEPRCEIQEIEIAGEWAYCWNRLSVRMMPRQEGEVMRREGHTLTIFRKAGGAWVLARDANMLALA